MREVKSSRFIEKYIIHGIEKLHSLIEAQKEEQSNEYENKTDTVNTD